MVKPLFLDYSEQKPSFQDGALDPLISVTSYQNFKAIALSLSTNAIAYHPSEAKLENEQYSVSQLRACTSE
ncbi:MAG: hypothetical protein M3O33_12170 [Cyanobacteriota bacterium]|nr:hypothetical protein [Cyanobacteriota bacterium]